MVEIISTETFRQLVQSSAKEGQIDLPESNLEYLSFVLQQFSTDTSILSGTITGYHVDCINGIGNFQTLGDKCLIWSGLFPASLIKKRLTIDYVNQLGTQAYKILSIKDRAGSLYAELSKNFNQLVNVFHGIMGLACKVQRLQSTDSTINLYTVQSSTLH